MVSKKNFEILKKEYGLCGSWTIWELPGSTPKSNTGNMKWAEDPKLNEKVGTGFVFVGLNWAGGHGDQTEGGTIKWKDFHSDYAYQNDYKLRHALTGTRYWGSYITDIIKYYPETDSSKVDTMIKNNPSIVRKNIEHFEKELSLLGDKEPVLVALGGSSYELLKKHFGRKYTIVKIKHYSFTISKENYRKEVLETLDRIKK